MMRKSFQVMPSLTEDEYNALRDDIKQHGILVPITVDQYGRILDGHHRKKIADELGIVCPQGDVQVGGDEDARQTALALNMARRHLTRDQRHVLLCKEIKARPGDSDRAIAQRLGCSPSTVGAARPQLSKLDSSKRVGRDGIVRTTPAAARKNQADKDRATAKEAKAAASRAPDDGEVFEDDRERRFISDRQNQSLYRKAALDLFNAVHDLKVLSQHTPFGDKEPWEKIRVNISDALTSLVATHEKISE